MAKPKKMTDEELRALETEHWQEVRKTARLAEAGHQISLRLPHATLDKLNRLARNNVQTKSQFITRLLQRIPSKYLQDTTQPLATQILDDVLKQLDNTTKQ